MTLLKALHLLLNGVFSRRLIPLAHFDQSDFFQHSNFFKYDFFSQHKFPHSFCQIFPALRSFFFPNFPGTAFIRGPTFILFAKSSRPYAYSLPFVYCGL